MDTLSLFDNQVAYAAVVTQDTNAPLSLDVQGLLDTVGRQIQSRDAHGHCPHPGGPELPLRCRTQAASLLPRSNWGLFMTMFSLLPRHLSFPGRSSLILETGPRISSHRKPSLKPQGHAGELRHRQLPPGGREMESAAAQVTGQTESDSGVAGGQRSPLSSGSQLLQLQPVGPHRASPSMCSTPPLPHLCTPCPLSLSAKHPTFSHLLYPAFILN